MKYPDVSLGQVEAMCNMLGGSDGVRRFLAGEMQVIPRQHADDGPVIDCDTLPDHKNWEIHEHEKGGLLRWNHSRVGLFFTSSQLAGKGTNGHTVRKELEGKKVLNACVLDFLIANKQFIPPEWQKLCVGESGKLSQSITFWGTLFKYKNLGPEPFSLAWSNDQSNGYYGGMAPYGLDSEWTSSPAAILLD